MSIGIENLTPVELQRQIGFKSTTDGKIMAESDKKPVKDARYSIAETRRAAAAVERTRMSNKTWAERRKEMREAALSPKQNEAGKSSWKRETLTLPRDEAREFTRRFLKKYPKAAYWSEVESWRVLPGDIIEFTVRRLPSAD